MQEMQLTILSHVALWQPNELRKYPHKSDPDVLWVLCDYLHNVVKRNVRVKKNIEAREIYSVCYSICSINLSQLRQTNVTFCTIQYKTRRFYSKERLVKLKILSNHGGESKGAILSFFEPDVSH